MEKSTAVRVPAIIPLLDALGGFLRRAWQRRREARQARLTRYELSRLSDHALRDIGLARSEVDSITAEFAGDAERTRLQRFVR